MKLLRYGAKGSEKPAVLSSDGLVRDLSKIVSDINPDSLESLDWLKGLDIDRLPLVPKTERIGACVGKVGKFMGIGLNYSDHAAETGQPVPPEPILFLKATSAICGPNDPIIIPRNSVATDWEVELGVVIGKSGKYIDQAKALDHVAGYCVVNDVSERNFQTKRQGQWSKGKSCDNFAPIGPWLVTKDEVPDPQNLPLWLKVNGELRQNGSTQTMAYGVAFLVAYLSQFMTLYAGDIISTGTPPGVGMGMKPPKYLAAGDRVELSVNGTGMGGLGIQSQVCIAD